MESPSIELAIEAEEQGCQDVVEQPDIAFIKQLTQKIQGISS
jgi:hypothetical protein